MLAPRRTYSHGQWTPDPYNYYNFIFTISVSFTVFTWKSDDSRSGSGGTAFPDTPKYHHEIRMLQLLYISVVDFALAGGSLKGNEIFRKAAATFQKRVSRQLPAPLNENWLVRSSELVPGVCARNLLHAALEVFYPIPYTYWLVVWNIFYFPIYWE